MGRKGQAKQKHEIKPKHGYNLTSNQRKLQQLIDKLLRLTTSPPELNISKSLEYQKEINKLTDQVQTFEKEIELASTVDIRGSGDTLERFTNWMKENGAKFDGIKISEFPGYELGLQTENDIKESSLIITIPRELMLTMEGAKNSEMAPFIEKDPLLSNMPNVALAMFLLLEKFRGNSFWKPYIDVLPTAYSTILYFNLDDLKELQTSPTLESALKQIKNIVRQYAYFYKLIWTSEDPACKILRQHYTFNQYRWAVSTVMTRQNTIPSEDGSHYKNALIPLWDFINHTSGNISTDYNAELKRSECLALKDFKAGEQIFIFYGARSNTELFIHNGFVYDDNEHDGYWLHLGMSKSDALKEKRVKLLSRLCLPDNGDFWLKLCSEPVDSQLLAFLRIFNMSEEQLDYWLQNDEVDHLQNLQCNFDPDFEKKYWGFLLIRLKLILATYKTSRDEDFELIANADLPRNKILAIQMRAAEKKILKCSMAYIEQRLQEY